MHENKCAHQVQFCLFVCLFFAIFLVNKTSMLISNIISSSLPSVCCQFIKKMNLINMIFFMVSFTIALEDVETLLIFAALCVMKRRAVER